MPHSRTFRKSLLQNTGWVEQVFTVDKDLELLLYKYLVLIFLFFLKSQQRWVMLGKKNIVLKYFHGMRNAYKLNLYIFLSCGGRSEPVRAFGDNRGRQRILNL